MGRLLRAERGIRRAREEGGSPVAVGCGGLGRRSQIEAVPGGQAGRVGTACQVPGGWWLICFARSAIWARSLALISSCVSNLLKAPDPVTARLKVARGLGGRQLEDDQAVVSPEHPVVGLHAAVGRLHQP